MILSFIVKLSVCHNVRNHIMARWTLVSNMVSEGLGSSELSTSLWDYGSLCKLLLLNGLCAFNLTLKDSLRLNLRVSPHISANTMCMNVYTYIHGFESAIHFIFWRLTSKRKDEWAVEILLLPEMYLNGFMLRYLEAYKENWFLEVSVWYIFKINVRWKVKWK